MLNNIVLSGVLVRDPELRLYKNDQSTPYAFATLVSTKGSRSQKTVLIPIRLHGKQAEAFCEYKKKGDRVDVVGYVDSFIDKNNQLKVFVHASHCEFRERKKDPDPDSRNEYTQDYDWPDDNLDEIEDSDIPF